MTPQFYIRQRYTGDPVEIRYGISPSMAQLVAKVGFDLPIHDRLHLARQIVRDLNRPLGIVGEPKESP